MAIIRALQAFRGIGFLTALTIAAEASDLSPFRTAPQLMAYAGLVPSESSSGSKQHRGSIIRPGNSLLWHVFGEAAHHARHAPRVAGTLKRRQTDLPQEMVAARTSRWTALVAVGAGRDCRVSS
ncbi:MAG: transposase [Chloroflexi bacterium]|nr:transposase [Chloroflexota bacterium]